MSSIANQFSSADSAMGYLYQARLALLWALKRLKESSDFVVSLETIDDVTFETNGRPDELLQIKHHLTRPVAFIDASLDLWKSLCVWFEGASEKTIPPQTHLYLVTTSSAGVGSAAAKLRQSDRDVASALSTLETTAQNFGQPGELIRFRSAHAAGALLTVLCVAELIADPVFRPLDQWLRRRQVNPAELQAAVNQFLEQARQEDEASPTS